MSTTQIAGRKRHVSTCTSCYNRKQKCDRRYPCNHCTRRRRPEQCVYRPPPTPEPAEAMPLLTKVTDATSEYTEDSGRADSVIASRIQSFASYESTSYSHDRTLVISESFGYYEGSSLNTVALLKIWHPGCLANNLPVRGDIPSQVLESVQADLGSMPQRQILDFLVQYFVSELNWMKQIVHAPSFLLRYQQWWLKERLVSPEDIEFAVLILRICVYASHFLPSLSHSIDSIDGLSLTEIRSTCDSVGNSLSKICVSLDWSGSIVRVQHLLFAAMSCSCEGKTHIFWEAVACACKAAQKAGIHNDSSIPSNSSCEWDQEMQRRVFCVLYILDSHLSRQLDRVPFIPSDSMAGMLPRMHLVTDSDHASVDSGAPESFTERLMQVHLAQFWRRFRKHRNGAYDPTQAEQRYEQFCAEYLPNLPPAFALKPDKQFDKHLPRLAMQRHLLHISILDCVCWNFRPVLLLKPNQIAEMAEYKQVLLRAQKRILATAALRELDAIAALHSMSKCCYTRCEIIIFNTFEACVLLFTLCIHADFLDTDCSGHFLGLEAGALDRETIMRAVRTGQERLQMLAGVSQMAATGAQTLEQLVSQTPSVWTSPLMLDGASWSASIPDTLMMSGYGAVYDEPDAGILSAALAGTNMENICASW